MTQLLHFSITGQLGAGGMGVVYRAIDTRLERPVALKFLPDNLARQPAAKQRLLLEAKAAAQLDHPNIGAIYGIEEAEGRLFIVMALYQGETLQARLARGPATLATALDWSLQAAAGLAKAHAAGIVHRDIKPGNLFLTDDGLLKILDFGLVKFEAPSGLTTAGALVGTPEYMAPEQVRGLPIDPRVDVWGLAVVLYEALTGVNPFRAEAGLPATILRVMTTTPPPLAELAPQLPAALQGVLDRALAKDPDERFESVAEFAAELARAGAIPTTATSPGRDPHPPPPTSAATGAVTGAATGTKSDSDLQPLLEAVPRPQRFVGREGLLAHLEERLARGGGLVALRGMAGTGKSALGAQLLRARYPESRICWFTFDPVEKNTADALYWTLAAFLASVGETLLWRYLRGELEAHRPLDRSARLNLLLTSLQTTPVGFGFDEVQLVARDTEVTEIFKGLQRQLAGGAADAGTSLVLIGRELPADLEHLAHNLEGLAAPEVPAFLAARGLELPAETATRLHERTLGNPTLLELAASAIAQMRGESGAIASFVESMAGRHDIRDYVMNHVCADLTADERAVLDALSIFTGAVEAEVAEEVLAAFGVAGATRCTRTLVEKSIAQESDQGLIDCHDLVREFCYRTLEARARRALHGHAARVYESRKNPLRAAHHTFEGGDVAGALAHLSQSGKGIIEAGGAASLLEQLLRFDPRGLDDEQNLALVLIKGDVLMVRGAYMQALTLYELALDDVLDGEGQAELLTRLATVCNELGDHQRAIEAAQAALAALRNEAAVRPRARIQRVLGMAHYRLGELQGAATAFEAGLALAERAGDAPLSAYLDQYLGIVDAREGRLEAARERFERSRRTFRAERDRSGEVEAMGNLAWVFGLLGEPEREAALLAKVLEILERVGDVGYLLILYNNLGHIEHHAGRHEAAMAHHERLVELSRRVNHRAWLSTGLVGLAEDLLALRRVEEARERAEAAHRLLQDAEGGASHAVELALCERVLGEIALAAGDVERATAWFHACIPTFERTHEVDELAKAQLGLEAAKARA
jgi:tetratricopeptide (TPR) repeat protein